MHKLRPIAVLLASIACATASAAVPTQFVDEVVWSGLNLPTAVRFAPNGQVFVAEKSGIIKVFDSVADPSPSIYADLRAEVHDYHDHGLLALAIDPDFPASPYVYAFYSLDAPPGTAPPFYRDECPGGVCPSTSRLSLLTGTVAMLSKSTLLEGWCHDFPWHSTADLIFGAGRVLYVSHGEGANFNFADYGQTSNHCGDPVNQGGALRAQDLRTPADSLSLVGSVLRIDPDTGAAAPDNPLIGGSTADDSIIAYGLRNPYRMSIDPQTGRLWIADVGYNDWEEVNTIASPTASVRNFGWPCYEGVNRHPTFDSLNLPICEALYADASAQGPHHQYGHTFNGGAISGIALYRAGNFPPPYRGALFFADYTQGWIKAMLPAASGVPDPQTIVNLVDSGAAAVDLQVSPTGHLYYADIFAGAIRRVRYESDNTAPTAVIAASATFGALPLSVSFNAAGSSDPDPGDTLSYAWDLDGDGQFDDSAAVAPGRVYTVAAAVTVRLRVTDTQGETSIASVVVDAGNTPPDATILTPSASLAYTVGQSISFSGQAVDAESGTLPPSALNWRVILHHCAVQNPSDCHEHFVQEINGVAAGTFTAPDHEYPVRLELRLTARTGTLTDVAAVMLQPQTATLTLQTIPAGLQVGAYAQVAVAPLTRQVVVGARTTIAAESPQTLGGVQYDFAGWSDGGAAAHLVTIGSGGATWTATFVPRQPSCTLSVSPASIVAGGSATLSWTSSNASTLSIDQGIGGVTPVGSGSRTVSPTSTITYTGSVSGASGAGSCSAQLTVAAAGAETLWRSQDVQPQAGTPQGLIFSAAGDRSSTLEFYESTNNAGVARGGLFGTFTPGGHAESFNRVERVWSSGSGYPYVGKSTVDRGVDVGESNAPAPLGVRDLQLHPPENAHLVVAAFRVPEAGSYQVSELAVRRVDGNAGYSVRLRLFDAQGVELASVQGVSRAWARHAGSFNLGTLSPGSTIYFAVDRDDGNYYYDATEIAWVIRSTSAGSPLPSCTLSAPASIVQGSSAALSWTSNNATSISINQGIGAVSPVSSGSRTVSPTVSTTYTASVNGPGGTASCAVSIAVTAAPPLPSCMLSAPASIVQGSSAALSWTSSNASSISINQGIGAVTPVGSGSRTVSPAVNTTYTASVNGPGGTASCAVSIAVTAAPLLPSCTLSAPASIVQGSSAALSWTSSNVTSISIDQGIGAVTPVGSGSRMVSPTSNTTYTASVSGAGGTASCAASIAVTALPLPSCTMSINPASITSGGSATLSWTSSNASTLSIDQGIGAVTPVSAGSRTVSATSTTTYTGNVSGASGSGSCSAQLTVQAAGAETLWRSQDVQPQAGIPQALIFSAAGDRSSTLEFYESSNDAGVARAGLFGTFGPGAHADSFNRAERVWSGGGAYPYVGKSTVDRGVDVGESNAPAPLGVRDLQLHPPENAHLVVAAFRVPEAGSYQVSELAVRRVDGNAGYSVRLRLFDAQGVELGSVQAVSRAWARHAGTFDLGTLSPGSTIYFAVDRDDGNYYYDATEIAWLIRATSTGSSLPSCTLSAPASIVQGSSATLSWASSNATSISINQGIGAVTPVSGGSRTVSPAVNTTYTASVNGPGGTASCAVSIAVTAAPPLPSCTLSAPASIVQGSSAALSWTTSNATSISINQGIGAVSPVSSGSRTVSPTVNTTYTASVNGPGGTASCAASIAVTAAPPLPSCTLSAPASIVQGSSATLSWASSNATSISINQGIGAVTPVGSGSRTVNPTVSTTYTASVNGAGGAASCAASIVVTAPQAPSCTLSVSPTSITAGGSATLSWTSSNASTLSIDQGIGGVTPVGSGSRTVSPTSTITYTGSVSGASGSGSCSAQLTVAAAGAETLWRSQDVQPQAGTPQGLIFSAAGDKSSTLEFYESTNNAGVARGGLFGTFTPGGHAESFNRVERVWSSGSGYPYVGKSTVDRGVDVGESNAPAPLGVRDLQLHPPENAHLVVAAFRVPEAGSYQVSELAVRRVDGNAGYSVRLRLFDAQGVELASVQGVSRAWARHAGSFNLGTLSPGSTIYFAVDRDDGNYYYDATEIAWVIRRTP